MNILMKSSLFFFVSIFTQFLVALPPNYPSTIRPGTCCGGAQKLTPICQQHLAASRETDTIARQTQAQVAALTDRLGRLETMDGSASTLPTIQQKADRLEALVQEQQRQLDIALAALRDTQSRLEETQTLVIRLLGRQDHLLGEDLDRRERILNPRTGREVEVVDILRAHVDPPGGFMTSNPIARTIGLPEIPDDQVLLMPHPVRTLPAPTPDADRALEADPKP